MKTTLTTTLLLVLLLSSCSTSKDTNYKTFYREINKEYGATRTIDARSTGLKPDKGNTQNSTKSGADSINQFIGEIANDLKGINKSLNEKKTVQATAATTATSTSPTTSAAGTSTRTTLASIEQERNAQKVRDAAAAAASERQKTEQIAAPVAAVKTPSAPKQAEEDLSKVFKNDEYEIVYPEDEDLLKKYNVVIASLSKIAGVERLKNTFEASENPEHLIVVKNKKGLYYMIQGSFDDMEEALSKRKEVIEAYVKRYSEAALKKQYGIPFADLRIVSKKEK